MLNHFVCTGMNEDCHKCPKPAHMSEEQLHGSILRGEKEDCVNNASQIYAKKISGVLGKEVFS